MSAPCQPDGTLESLSARAVMQIFAEFDSSEALVREFESNLIKARAFVLGSYDVVERQLVEFVLIHPVTLEWLPLKAEVVYIAPPEQAAVGLEILEWTPERSALIQAFVAGETYEGMVGDGMALAPPASPARARFELLEPTPHVDARITSEPDVAAVPLLSLHDAPDENAGYEASEPSSEEGPFAPDFTFDEATAEGYVHDPDEDGYDDIAPHSESNPPSSKLSVPPPKNVQERVRKLNMREREAMARGGTLTERVALERAYGAVVWDGLLANSALTGPEVARIAKNGNATIPHLTLIVNNPAWLAKGEVRRALLTNPRLTPPQIERVLRALPPAELKQLPKQTAYAPKVRAVALRMLSR